VTPRWIRIGYVAFGVTWIAMGISSLVKGDGDSTVGGIQVALGVGWLLLAAFKSKRFASLPKHEPDGVTVRVDRGSRDVR
jgi:hypothetical protein